MSVGLERLERGEAREARAALEGEVDVDLPGSAEQSPYCVKGQDLSLPRYWVVGSSGSGGEEVVGRREEAERGGRVKESGSIRAALQAISCPGGL